MREKGSSLHKKNLCQDSELAGSGRRPKLHTLKVYSYYLAKMSLYYCSFVHVNVFLLTIPIRIAIREKIRDIGRDWA